MNQLTSGSSAAYPISHCWHSTVSHPETRREAANIPGRALILDLPEQTERLPKPIQEKLRVRLDDALPHDTLPQLRARALIVFWTRRTVGSPRRSHLTAA
jgi:hypothetical protein